MLEIGSIVGGKYKVLSVIGQGGMSTVYLAMNERANKPWAIKEVRKDAVANYQTVRQSLITETDLLKELSHPFLPSIVDVIDEDESTGSYEVHAYTYKIDLRLEQENGQDNLRNLTQVGVEIQFDVSKKSDGSYVTSRYLVKVDDQTQDDFYKKQILDSLVGQAKSAKSDGK